MKKSFLMMLAFTAYSSVSLAEAVITVQNKSSVPIQVVVQHSGYAQIIHGITMASKNTAVIAPGANGTVSLPTFKNGFRVFAVTTEGLIGNHQGKNLMVTTQPKKHVNISNQSDRATLSFPEDFNIAQ